MNFSDYKRVTTTLLLDIIFNIHEVNYFNILFQTQFNIKSYKLLNISIINFILKSL